jgi:hypothetical protein
MARLHPKLFSMPLMYRLNKLERLSLKKSTFSCEQNLCLLKDANKNWLGSIQYLLWTNALAYFDKGSVFFFKKGFFAKLLQHFDDLNTKSQRQKGVQTCLNSC